VIAVDANILVYAHRTDSTFHASATACVRNLAEGAAAWAIPWTCLHEFYAIVTHPRIYDPPTSPARALDQIDAWLESPTLVLLAEDEAYWPTLRDTLETSNVQGPRVHDARIASLCISHGVAELWSADRDFSRFTALRARNPLSG
jgi:uncharacterized protein